MTDFDDLLNQGIIAARLDDRSTALQLLSDAVRQNPNSEQAWLWLSAVLDTTQARAHCLRQVLVINPNNRSAQLGLAALGAIRPTPTITAEESPQSAEPVKQSTVAPFQADRTASPDRMPQQSDTPGNLEHQTLFWQVVVACLAVVALCLVGSVVYVSLNGTTAAQEERMADFMPTREPPPRGTLRPTFTPTATHTPTPTLTPTPTGTPTSAPTDTPIPTNTSTPTSTPSPKPTRKLVVAALAAPTATPRPRVALPPRSWDARLDQLGVRVDPAPVGGSQPFWRLVSARWTNEQESGGKHSVYVEVLDRNGNRAVGQPVVVQWTGNSISLPVEDRPAPDWGVNFPMYSCLGSYAVSVGGAPAKRSSAWDWAPTKLPTLRSIPASTLPSAG